MEACGTGQQSQQSQQSLSGTLRVYKGPFTGDEKTWQQKMVAPFTQKYPNVKVVVEQFEWPNQLAQVTASLAANAHDLYYTAEDKYHTFSIAGGPFLDLTSYVNGWPDKDKVQFWDAAKPRGSALAGIPHIWNMQSNLVVNVDLAKKAGVDYQQITSYDAFIDAARKMTSSDVWGYVFRHGIPNDGQYDWQGFLFRNGTDLLTPDWSAPALNNSGGVQAIQLMSDFINKYHVCHPFGKYTWTEQRDLFQAGKVGILTDEFTYWGNLTAKPVPFKWDFLAFPQGTVNNHMLAFRGFWSIAKNSPVKNAAWELIKTYMTPSVEVPYLNAVAIASTRTDAIDAGLFKDEPGFAHYVNAWGPLAQGPQAHPKSVAMVTVAEPLIEQVFTGSVSAQQGLNKAAEQIKPLI
jgi:ABC-type glycerol-3-phosphate transport system substrate-binding protein